MHLQYASPDFDRQLPYSPFALQVWVASNLVHLSGFTNDNVVRVVSVLSGFSVSTVAVVVLLNCLGKARKRGGIKMVDVGVGRGMMPAGKKVLGAAISNYCR